MENLKTDLRRLIDENVLEEVINDCDAVEELSKHVRFDVDKDSITFVFSDKEYEEQFKRLEKLIIATYKRIAFVDLDEYEKKYIVNKEIFENLHKKRLLYLKNLNDDYKFSNYIKDKSNNIAYQIALNLANFKREKALFFLFGPSSVGKTHLISAILNETKKFADSAYFTSDDFLDRIHTAYKNKELEKIKKKFQLAQIICIDDIQNVQKSQLAENILFMLADLALIRKNRYLIITSDTSAEKLSFQDRLIKRFLSDLYAVIDYPSFFAKKEFFEKRLKIENIKIDKEIIREIINNCSTFRELSLIANHLTLQIKDLKMSTKTAVEETLSKFLSKEAADENKIIDKIAEYFNIQNDFYRKEYLQKDTKEFKASIILIYLLKNKLKIKINDIAKMFNKNRVTINRMLKKIDDKEIQKDLKRIEQEL